MMDDLRSADVDFLTIGQYLQPTPKHAGGRPLRHAGRVRRATAASALAKGFLMVSASPLTRSSYHAGDDFQRLKAARQAKLAGGACRFARLPPMPTHAEKRHSRYHARADCSTWSPTSSGIRSSCPGASPPASSGATATSIWRRPDHRLQDGPRALHLPRDPGSAKPSHRRGLYRRAVPLPQQPLDLQAGAETAAA